METKVIECNITNLKKPKLSIRGFFKNNDEIIIYADDKIVCYDNIDFSGYNIVFKDYVKKAEFKFEALIPKKTKQIKIYVKKLDKEQLIYKKEINFLSILKNDIYNLYNENKLLLISMIKNFKQCLIAWHKNENKKISKTIIKKYYKMWRYRIGLRRMEKKYYFPTKQNDYLKWINENEKSDMLEKFKYNPLISILVPVYNANPIYLKECIDSVLNQNYKNFELCIADDNSTNKETLNVLKEYENKDKRIKIIYRNKNGHISKATNSALEIANGEFIGLLDNDDVLDKNALYEVVKLLNEDKKIDMIYSDEDKIALNGSFANPYFKPDFSPNTLLSFNYICHFSVLRKSIVDLIRGFRSKYDGAQDYDLFLRVSEKTNNIAHISKVLYHWRETNTSTALNTKNKDYALQAGKLALEDALKRRKISGKVNVLTEVGKYFIEYEVTNKPKVSIIIPTKNKADILDKCLKSIYEKTNYKNYEIIVIDNNSDEESLFNLLEIYKEKYDNFYSYRYECEFNYSYLNNEAVKKATGEYIVLLNNDIEVITPDWVKIMVGYASQEKIGCVGAKLLYPSGNVQHAGVVCGLGGVASHIYVNAPDSEIGYQGILSVPRDVKMVTAACLMIKKSIFNKVNGLDENLKVAYNDVDLNVRIFKEGYYNIIVPQVKLFHYESISRGSDLTNTTKERFKNEIKYIVNKLNKDLMRDEFYNDNLSKEFYYVLDKVVKDE